MGLWNRAKLLEKEKIEIVKVDLGNDDFVYVRQMSGRERDRFEQSLVKAVKDEKGEIKTYENSMEDFRAKLAEVTLCDEKGNLLLKPGDYHLLSQNMTAKTLEKIVNEAQKLSKITEEDKEKLLKNSKADLADNSNLSSVEN
jgi:hypothetical protein